MSHPQRLRLLVRLEMLGIVSHKFTCCQRNYSIYLKIGTIYSASIFNLAFGIIDEAERLGLSVAQSYLSELVLVIFHGNFE